jgi:hypothetical protein
VQSGKKSARPKTLLVGTGDPLYDTRIEPEIKIRKQLLGFAGLGFMAYRRREKAGLAAA